MYQQQTLSAEPYQIVIQPHLASTDSVGTVSDSVPVHPENKHPSFDDFKHRNNRKPLPVQSSEESDSKRPDPDHLIDEYA
ncbi:hypothetical protein SCD_n01645 [Sulfuricella denitrificans skB26]|uniref:Uncharacterized protein n=1 Tax=Sulfuricella denitrificans (strain DSM 22764 / NBRC 105220 / skB26) TaxID=1163617 RepID=S6AH68_SULDS|nr:hypothetical protein [Sulfuricella denitrificans]BAN35466.1 hypothetical protein SCD_n01645 [Sulfuricella denitrificans skB26]